MNEEEIKKSVRRHYAEIVQGLSCCSPLPCFSYTHLEAIRYSSDELKNLPASIVEIASGCGNPVASADLKRGEVVLDLGSGGGIDVFLAARKVGPTGKVIGVDMTPEMIEKAKENAEKMGFQNVEFKLGEIENLPIKDESVDVIISNCVINLSPDKEKVFKEAYRVLKPRGQIVISDIVTQGELPRSVRESIDAWSKCVAGALEEKEYLEKIKKAGFKDIHVLSRSTSCCETGLSNIYSIKVRAQKLSI